jgi:hypothetical protein
MMEFLGLSMIVGAALGTRFSALVLGLAIFVDMALIVGATFVLHHGIRSNAFLMVFSATGLQIGYLVGAVVCFVVCGVRTGRCMPPKIQPAISSPYYIRRSTISTRPFLQRGEPRRSFVTARLN